MAFLIQGAFSTCFTRWLHTSAWRSTAQGVAAENFVNRFPAVAAVEQFLRDVRIAGHVFELRGTMSMPSKSEPRPTWSMPGQS